MFWSENIEYLAELDWEVKGTWFWLKYIEVHKKHRGKGIGERVIREFTTYCSQHKLNFFLYPANSNTRYMKRLISFYARCGLEQIENEGFVVFVKYHGKVRPKLPKHP